MYKKLSSCKYCMLSFEDLDRSSRANHSRWCKQNPKREQYVLNNNAKHLQTREIFEKRKETLKKTWESGAYNNVDFGRSFSGKHHSNKSKEAIRVAALKSTHRRLVKSTREYVKRDGSSVRLDSRWEELLAIRLDELHIEWDRPAPIKWVDRSGIVHNYFPDFYLPLYNLYLDPKNPYAVKAQASKLECLRDQIRNLVIITTEDECINFKPEIYK